MKMMKKVATLLLAVCLVVPCFSMLTYARNAIMFEDPSTKVGETLTLKGVVELNNNIEDRKIVMTYDTSMLKFKDGDNVAEDAPGQLTYSATGEAGGKRVEFLMNFDVLKEGTTKVEVTSHEVYNTSDARVTCQQGSSTITIAAGEAPSVTPDEPTTEEPTDVTAIVDVNGVSYTFSDAFTEEEIPQGFVAATIEYAGAEHKVVLQESSGLTLGYLVDAEGAGKFYVYVVENATFAPYETISISESTTIVLLTTVEDVFLPEAYAESTVTVNGVEFPAWQNAEEPDYCVLYAMNHLGEKSLYRFDIKEETYQRFEAPVIEQEEEKTSMFGTLTDMLQNHLDYVILAGGLGFILFVIIVIILSVKLYNRNAELDELYDEYGIDLDDEEEEDDTDIFDNMVINIDDEDEEEDAQEADEEDSQEADEEADEESSIFVDIEEEVEDDIVIEEAEAEDVVVEEEEVKKSPTDDLKELEAALQADEEEYLDDDEEVDFEMDFIDLDD